MLDSDTFKAPSMLECTSFRSLLIVATMYAPRWWPRWLESRSQDILGGGKVLESTVWLVKIGTFFAGPRSQQREHIPLPVPAEAVLGDCDLVRTCHSLSA